MTQDLIHKLLRYLTQGAVIYLLFKYVPKSQMKDSDILIVTAIILLVYIIAENCYQMYFGKTQSDCACNIKEGFDNSAITNSLSQIGGINSTGASYDLSSIGSSLSQITTGSGQSVTSLPTSTVTQPDPISEADLAKLKQQSAAAFQQGQTQMQQAQTQLFDQSVQNMQNQIQQVAQAPKTVPSQAPQITFPIQSEAVTKPVSGYVKNADGTFTITSVNPVSQQPFSYNYTDYNTLPVTTGPGTFEYGYSFLPSSSWYPTPTVPPVCISSGPTCPVCPIYTQGTNLDLKEWNASLSIMPSEQINIKIN